MVSDILMAISAFLVAGGLIVLLSEVAKWPAIVAMAVGVLLFFYVLFCRDD